MPIAITWKHVLRVWLAFLWRATGAVALLWGACLLLAVAFGIVAIKFAHMSVAQAEQVAAPYYIAGIFLAFPFAGLIALRLLMKAKFSGFRLALLPDDAQTAAVSLDDGWMRAPQAPPPAWGRPATR